MNKKIQRFFLIFLLISAGSHSQDFGIFSEKVILEKPFPHLVRPGETYLLRGTINGTPNGMISVVNTMPYGKWDYDYKMKIEGSTFEIPIFFKYPGTYSLEIFYDYETLISTHVLALEKVKIDSAEAALVRNFRIENLNGDMFLLWDSADELYQLKFIQQGRKQDVILSNHAQKFKLTDKFFQSFDTTPITVAIRGARSQDGTAYNQSSFWTDWQELSFVPEIKFKASKSSLFSQNAPFSEYKEVGESFEFRFNSREYIYPEVYIKRPDGKVDIVPIKSTSGAKKFSKAGMEIELIPPGKNRFTYIPNQEGTYFMEIVKQDGTALLWQPLYVGNIYPILSYQTVEPVRWQTTDSDSLEKLILFEINQIRQKLGLKELVIDEKLQNLAHYYAQKMAREHFCSHFSPDKQSPLNRGEMFKIITPLLENVAMANKAYIAHNNLILSPSHYHAMIDSTIERAGIGVAQGEGQAFYVAEYFSRFPYTAEQKEKFLASLFQEMSERRARTKSIPKSKRQLKRIYSKYSFPSIITTIITDNSLENIREKVLGENANKTWKLETVGQVYFETFEENIHDGIKLVIRFYPFEPKSKK